MTLQSFEPLSELRRMERTMDSLWRGLNGRNGQTNEGWYIPLDVAETESHLVVEASIPGVAVDEIDLSVDNDVLTITAQKEASADNGRKYIMKERAAGRFHRALRLPDSADTDNVESFYENGVLTVSIPKAEAKRKRKIEVAAGNPGQVLEAKAS